MEKNGVDVCGVASAVSVSVTSVYRYLRGDRIPDPPVMKRLRQWTNGEVTADDFYQDSQRAEVRT